MQEWKYRRQNNARLIIPAYIQYNIVCGLI